jgi:pantoate--beta-alanine ligase
MTVIENVHAFKDWRRELQEEQLTLGFVPTMGALHAGHLSLFERAKQECDRVAISIFVNPTQFNDPKDLEKYPRPLDRDLELARQKNVDVVFLPNAKEMYSDEYRYQMRETKVSQILCGATRPGHFEGVLTVVMKLLNITSPNRAYFGEKDYQQFLLIRDMAKAFFMDCEVLALPTMRELDGLAMSSRNVRLTPEERKLAPLLFSELKSKKPLSAIRTTLEAAGFRIDYLEELFGRRFIAAFLGEVRLIDNV